MARRAIDGWSPYVDDVLALWTELGDDFKVGRLARQDVVSLRGQLQTALEQVNALQAQLGLAMGERDGVIDKVEEFAVKFRSAVIAQFGPRSPEARRVPRVSHARRTSAPPPPKTG